MTRSHIYSVNWASVAINLVGNGPRIGIEIETPPTTDSSAFHYVIEAHTENSGVIRVAEEAFVNQRMGRNNRLGHIADSHDIVHWLTGGDTRFNTNLGFNMSPRHDPARPGHVRWEVYRYNNNLQRLVCRLSYWPDKENDPNPMPQISQEFAVPAYRQGGG